ncbi:hypothetical protein THUN1379_05980 [Paludibacterium sp. THUN1379]|uniref:TetR/AcrR family transcriptional regulator n=1 Tax=Paludibacterium sp. THUN1379 TaxID=3112107 RepID=UPI003093A5F0|nr:hypothetical protein THUN1379_05980 [Paludibacterium sp. THUN1379]
MSEKKDQPIDLMTKKPKQARARLTVKLIFESTAQIILREGVDKLTTNRIAEVAGFSVGTLYQYFRNKEAILLAMARHETEHMIGEIDALFDEYAGAATTGLAGALVGFLMQTFYHRRAIRRQIACAIFQRQVLLNLYPVIAAVESHVAQCLLDRQAPDMRMLSEAEAYVASRSLIGTLRAGVLEHSEWADHPAFQQALERQLLAMLLPTDGGGG